MPNRSNRRASGRTSPLLLVVLLISVGTAVVVGAMYYKLVVQPSRESNEDQKVLMGRMTGLSQPVVNQLDRTLYSDSNNDGLADVPSDPAKLIDPPTLTFSYVPEAGDASTAVQKWKPFTDYLAKVTGKPVEFVQFANVDELMNAIRAGRLHVAGLNTGAVAVAADLAGFIPVARVPGADGRGTHVVRIIAPANTSMKSAEDLRGGELTLTRPDSSSGYRAPLVLLKEKGLVGGSDYLLRYSGGHEASIIGVAAGKIQAAAVAGDMLDRAIEQGTVKQEQIKIIYESNSFPNAGLGYVYNLKPELAVKVKDAILTFDAKGSSLASYFPPSAASMKFLPANYKEDWALVRSVDNAIGYTHRLPPAATQPAKSKQG